MAFVTVNLSSTVGNDAVSAPVVVPDGMDRVTVFGRASVWSGAVATLMSAPPTPPGSSVYVATSRTFSVDGCTREIECAPGEKLVIETTTADSGADTEAVFTLVFTHTGPRGNDGGTGTTGAQGPPGINWRGDWDGISGYLVGDGVAHNGSSYLAILASGGHGSPVEPGVTGGWATSWAVLAQGTVLDKGNATLSSGTVTVSSAAITASRDTSVFITVNGAGTVAHLGSLYEDFANRVDGVSFDIKSTDALCDATVAWEVRTNL